MNRRRLGFCLMLLGLAAVAAGLIWMGFNLWDSHRAGAEAQRVYQVLLRYSQENPPAPDGVWSAEEEMPAVEIEDHRYIGILSVPSLELELPVMESWSYPDLKLSPCRYTGSAYTGDMVICAHNYATHFGKLKYLREGEEIAFTDLDGNLFSYTVAQTDTLPPTALEELTGGGWDLTLFTCTVGGQARLAVRCQEAI